MKTRSGSRFPITEHTKVHVLDGGVPIVGQSSRVKLTAIGRRYVSPSTELGIMSEVLESVSKILDRMDKQMEQLHKLQSFDDADDFAEEEPECDCDCDVKDEECSPEFIKFKTYTISPVEAKYLLGLPKEKLEALIQNELEVRSQMDQQSDTIPLRFRLAELTNISLRTKRTAYQMIDMLNRMEPRCSEYFKLSGWLESFERIPFGQYSPKYVGDDIRSYLQKARHTLDTAVFGHDIAKTQIIHILANEAVNPETKGRCIAIQGPMGNGKTTLIKDGICRAMGRPFALIALGGASDVSYLIGHQYTYEGSRPGKIVEVLQQSGTMDPVIFFDELDKVSKTSKGEEIENLLCHLTDPSQNMCFHDRYFSGVDFDLSRATFIFSYNNESAINPILLDRMIKIRTEGFDRVSKTKIAMDYLIPTLLQQYSFQPSDVMFEVEALQEIIDTYTEGENGVRNLRRCLDTILSKVNTARFLGEPSVDSSTIVNYEIRDFGLPYRITKSRVSKLIENTSIHGPSTSNQVWKMMYL